MGTDFQQLTNFFLVCSRKENRLVCVYDRGASGFRRQGWKER